MKNTLYLFAFLVMFTQGAHAENKGNAENLPNLTKSYAETFLFGVQHDYYPWIKIDIDIGPPCQPYPACLTGGGGHGGPGGPFPFPHVPIHAHAAPDGIGTIVSGDLCIDHYLDFDEQSKFWCTSINGTLSYNIETKEGNDELQLFASDGSLATISRSIRTGGVFSVAIESAEDNGSWYWNTTTLRLKNQEVDVNDEKIESINIEEVYGSYNGGKDILFIDTREPEEFSEGHIPGAINLPLRDIKHLDIADLPTAPLVVPYCLKNFRGYEVAVHLKDIGLPVALLQDGFVGWVSGGYPVE